MSTESILLWCLNYLGAVALFVSAYFWLFKPNHRGLHLPRGPRGLPILGSLPFLGKDLHKTFQKMAQEYGSVFGLFIGTQYFIVVEDFNAVKEICMKDEFLDRPPDYFRISPKYQNLVALSGAEWKDHRLFQVNTLKALGMTKSSTHAYALGEIEKAISALKQRAHEPKIDLDKMLEAATDNIVYFILYGKPFEPDHPYMLRFPYLVQALSEVYRWAEDAVFKPWLKLLIPIMYPRKIRAYTKEIDYVADILRKEVEDHRNTLDPNDPRDFIDYFLLEMGKRKNPVADGYTDNSLIGNVIMLLIAGSATTRLTMTWYLMTLAGNQEVQEKCYQEIMNYLGPERDPGEGDQCRLPYLCASIAESERKNPISYLNLLRQCNKDGVKISGFDVPKGTVLLQNLWSINYNKDLWKDPETYRPERFLYQDQQSFQSPEQLTPFSYGKRQCPGMKLATTELFLLAVCFIRSFRFLPPEDGLIMDEVLFFNAIPKEPFVRVEVRKQPFN